MGFGLFDHSPPEETVLHSRFPSSEWLTSPSCRQQPGPTISDEVFLFFGWCTFAYIFNWLDLYLLNISVSSWRFILHIIEIFVIQTWMWMCNLKNWIFFCHWGRHSIQPKLNIGESYFFFVLYFQKNRVVISLPIVII